MTVSTFPSGRNACLLVLNSLVQERMADIILALSSPGADAALVHVKLTDSDIEFHKNIIDMIERSLKGAE